MRVTAAEVGGPERASEQLSLALAPFHRQEPVAKSEKAGPRSQQWLHRDLRVRFVDRQHKGGQYYNTKVGTLQPGAPSAPRD